MIKPSSLIRSVTTAVVAVALALSGGVLAPATAATGNPSGAWSGEFYEGQVQYSTIINCISIIQGNAYAEKGAGAWVGVLHNPDQGRPMSTDSTYVSISVYGLGNSCAGMRFLPSIALPSGTGFDTSRPVRCFFGDQHQEATPQSSDCPGWAMSGANPRIGGAQAFYSTDDAHANLWPLPSGGYWDFWIPVTVSTSQVNATVHGFAEMADGNDNPTLHPTGSLYTFGAQTPPSVQYQQPSTYASATLPWNSNLPAKYGIVSQASVNTQGLAGRLFFQIGTATGQYDPDEPGITIGAGYNAIDFATDWDEAGIPLLERGSTYFWRAGFDPGTTGGGDVVLGAEQKFRLPETDTCLGHDVTVSIGLGQVPTAADDVILGTAGNDAIHGLGGNDVICALGGNDSVDGDEGDDLVDAGAGNDQVGAVEGSDTVRGGAGNDTASYLAASTAITLNLGLTGAQDTQGGGIDTLTGFENAIGGLGSDSLVGNAGPNLLAGGAGADTLNGGRGVDTVSYASSSVAVKVDLAAKGPQATGQGSDTLVGLERIIGTAKGDVLRGTAGANRLVGGGGVDRLYGLGGNDALVGGAGKDTCDGGAGKDTASGCEIRRSIP